LREGNNPTKFRNLAEMMDDVKNADSDYDNMSSQESLPEAEPLEAQPQNNGSE